MSINCLVVGNTREGANGIQMRNGVSRGRSHVVPENYALRSSHDMMNGGKWDNLPGELLLDIIQRVECSDISWLSRRDMVACAAVCRSWRDTVKQIVKSPEQCGLITFPMSLKQPGPRNTPIQCFIRRDRAASTFLLYLGLSPALAGDASKLLLVAKKVRKATRTEFLISLTADGFSRASNTCVGKLSSNFLGTKFSVYDTQRSYDPAMKPTAKFSLKKVSPVVPLVVKSKVATISYELNVLRTKGPRRMHCNINSIPASLVQEGGYTVTQPTFPDQTTQNPLLESSVLDKTEPLILRNKAPRWHEQLQCWCLNFKGRVTVASVKNFQLAVDSSQNGEAAEQDDVILQFGKIGKDIFTMDYQYPLSAFQAFAICLSSFDTKPACE
ncbi:F-box domain, Tubby domain-containing protein [Artemisia annua]|uniref:Tubby-like F-box protein n=1 Tax=Artemisia annua TaxID=35608 RepID=A0A2U1QN07_ARTAN|nr:F-box domain, Tubby domain-containing protein [Artemisia annua]